LEDPVASTTYFDVEEHHYGMFGVFNKMLEITVSEINAVLHVLGLLSYFVIYLNKEQLC